MTIRKVCLDIIFRDWWETDLSEVSIDIKKEDVINIQVIDGAVYLFYWAYEKYNQKTNGK